MAVPPLADAVSELANAFSGELLQPTDSGYEEARRVHNGLIDKRPSLIARCSGTADVVDAVNLARERGLEVSVRGGGHNVAGRAVVDEGLMIDLSLMKGIHVDPNSAGTSTSATAATSAASRASTDVNAASPTGVRYASGPSPAPETHTSDAS